MVLLTDLAGRQELAEGVLEELTGGGRFVAADVVDTQQVADAIAAAERLGPLRVCVNCAGIGPRRRTLARDGTMHSLEEFQRTVNVNLVGTFDVSRRAAAVMAGLPELDGGARGVIVNTSSIAAFDGRIGQAGYSASKAGVAGMTLPLARDLGVAGVRVCTIAPGAFDTPLLAAAPQWVVDELVTEVPFPPRLGSVSEFAQLVLAVVENDYLNGTVVRLDGGLRMQR